MKSIILTSLVVHNYYWYKTHVKKKLSYKHLLMGLGCPHICSLTSTFRGLSFASIIINLNFKGEKKGKEKITGTRYIMVFRVFFFFSFPNGRKTQKTCRQNFKVTRNSDLRFLLLLLLLLFVIPTCACRQRRGPP